MTVAARQPVSLPAERCGKHGGWAGLPRPCRAGPPHAAVRLTGRKRLTLSLGMEAAMNDTSTGRIRIRQTTRPDAERTPPVHPRTQICPLLAGLNRMGCRGPHCQWWIPYDDAEAGDCAMVFLALGSRSAADESLVGALRGKRTITAEWHETLGCTELSIRKTEAAGSADAGESPATPPVREPLQAAPPNGPAPSKEPAKPETPKEPVTQEPGEEPDEEGSAAKFARTQKGMSRQQVEALWGKAHQIRNDPAGVCYVYRLPEGGRLYLIFEEGVLTRVAKW
jgi:hypothetical protein